MAHEQTDLDQLKLTLSQLEAQLETSDQAEHGDLIALRQDLTELIALQEEQLLTDRKTALLKQLQDELNKCTETVASNNQPQQAIFTDVTEELKQVLVGQKCSIGGWTANGRFVRQNAVICDVVDEAAGCAILEQQSPASSDAAGRVRVFLTHPTRTTDLPCVYFMTNGFCHRGIRCPWSHGKIVSSKDIREWIEPDVNLYIREGQPCLVKEQPNSSRLSIWRHAHLLHTDLEAQTCVIQWGHKYYPDSSCESGTSGVHSNANRRTSYDQLETAVANVPVHAVWPLTDDADQEVVSEADDEDDLLSTDSDESPSDGVNQIDDSDVPLPVRPRSTGCVKTVDESLHNRGPHVAPRRSKITFVPGGVLSPEDVLRAMPLSDPVELKPSNAEKNASELGAWEAHTRGIGSRLLAQMGYSGQGGLGVDGTGRPLPVALLLEKFQILTDGWNKRPSLDRLLRVTEGPKKSRRSRRRLSNQNSDPSPGQTSTSTWQPHIFQFLNNALQRCGGDSRESTTSLSANQASSNPKENVGAGPSSGDFRVQLFRTHEEISRTKQQIARARESIERNQGRDRVVVKQAEQRLATLQSQLNQLRGRERALQQSKNKQIAEKKLRIF